MKTKTREVNRWKPVRRGEIYCSPGCGYGCTHKAYLTACLKAERIARRCGPGWKPRVWENLGWHYAATSPNNYVKVHPFREGGGYTVFFGWPEGVGGTFTTQDSNLKRAVSMGLKRARSEAAEAAKLVKEIESATLVLR